MKGNTMKATRVREVLDHRDYEVREDSDCCCCICWEIKEGGLLCNISSSGCYSSRVLVIDGEDVAEFVRYAGLQLYEIDDYPEDYEGEDDNDSLRDDVRGLIQLGEMVPRGFPPPPGPAHARAVRDSLRDYIESLVADGWRLYRDNERGFANEYDCVLVSPDVLPCAIDDDWDTLDVESWCAGYLYAGDPSTEAYNGIRIVE